MKGGKAGKAKKFGMKEQLFFSYYEVRFHTELIVGKVAK
jgi:hypothetical protein